MKIGTKSVLYGAHAFWLHPFIVAYAWWKLYGWRVVHDKSCDLNIALWMPQLWLAFFVHDLGYIGKPNMDGEEGEEHPFLGAIIMHIMCDWCWSDFACTLQKDHDDDPRPFARQVEPQLKWGYFAAYHSRFLAKRDGARFSLLCVADKFAICLTPRWLYLPMVNATGEIREYMKLSQAMNGADASDGDQKAWHSAMVTYVRAWVAEHKDGRQDTWTKNKTEADRNGVLK